MFLENVSDLETCLSACTGCCSYEQPQCEQKLTVAMFSCGLSPRHGATTSFPSFKPPERVTSAKQPDGPRTGHRQAHPPTFWGGHGGSSSPCNPEGGMVVAGTSACESISESAVLSSFLERDLSRDFKRKRETNYLGVILTPFLSSRFIRCLCLNAIGVVKVYSPRSLSAESIERERERVGLGVVHSWNLMLKYLWGGENMGGQTRWQSS